MSQLPSVRIPINTWVDLYAETGITVGVQIQIQNIGSSDAYLVDSLSQPDENSTGKNLIKNNNYRASALVPDGVWSYSDLGTTLQVEEV